MKRWKKKTSRSFGPEEINPFAYSLCTSAEKAFIDGVNELKDGFQLRAYARFQESIRADPTFMDSHFAAAALLLCRGNRTIARSRFLTIMVENPHYFGIHIARFMPKFRVMLNIRDDLFVRIRPLSTDIAFAVGVLYLREGQLNEAKKALQTAINADFGYEPSRVLMGHVLYLQGYYDEARKFVSTERPDVRAPFAALAMNTLGHIHMRKGDVLAGLRYLEGAASFPFKDHVALRSRFHIEAAREFEDQEYLEDALDNLKHVRKGHLTYRDEETVEDAFYTVKNRIITMRKSGITKSLTIDSKGKSADSRKESYWEFD